MTAESPGRAHADAEMTVEQPLEKVDDPHLSARRCSMFRLLGTADRGEAMGGPTGHLVHARTLVTGLRRNLTLPRPGLWHAALTPEGDQAVEGIVVMIAQ